MDRRRLRGRERSVLRGLRALLGACAALAGCGSPGGAVPPTSVDVGAAIRPPEAPAPVEGTALRPLPSLRPLTPAESDELDALVARLRDATSDVWPAATEEIARRFGGRGLVRALRGALPVAPPETRWFRTAQLVAQLERLADPGAADDLAAWIAAADDVHFRARGAYLLAQLGDTRAAEILAARLRLAPSEVYAPERFWEAGPGGHLSRSDQARVEAARALVDLARLHPEERGRLARVAAGAVTAWAEAGPVPHAHALRFLALVHAPGAREKLAAWATPGDPIPEPGAQPPFPVAFEIAQSALRAVGQTGDGAVLDLLERQLLRKDEALDISNEALASQSIVMRGMTLRALGFGAAQGLSELGDARAVAALERVVRDPRQHEEARVEACEALPWCAGDAGIAQLGVDLPKRAASTDAVDAFRATCLLPALAKRARSAPDASWAAGLRDEARPAVVAGTAALFAVAGTGPSDAAITSWLADDDLRPVAAAVLLLGGSEPSLPVAAAAASRDPRTTEQLHRIFGALATATEGHLQQGTLLRWARRFRVAGEPPSMREPLLRFLETVQLDAGPHTLTRVVLRRRLVELAVFGTAAEREDAKTVLALMNERGALDYLSRLSR